jgi:hypothetical protein
MGSVTYEYGISLAANMINAFGSGKSHEEMIKDQVTLILPLMPPNTKYLGYSGPRNVVSLANQYVLAFEHPYFEDGSKIDSTWVRAVYPDPDPNHGLRQFNLFMGLTFYRPDGTYYFSHQAPKP